GGPRGPRLRDDPLRLAERLLHVSQRRVDVAQRSPGRGEGLAGGVGPLLQIVDALPYGGESLRRAVEGVQCTILCVQQSLLRIVAGVPDRLARGGRDLFGEGGRDLPVQLRGPDVGDLRRDSAGFLVDVVLQRRLREITGRDAEEVLPEACWDDD